MSDRAPPMDPAPLSRTAAEMYDALRRFFVRRLRPSERAEADDLVQDVFMHLAQRGQVGVEKVDAYVYVTAGNVLRDRVRRQVTRRADAHERFDDEIHVPLEDRTPERVLIGRQSVETVRAALQSLPPRTRDIFVLYRFEELRRPEIARRLGISVSLVEKELAKAVGCLTEFMEKTS